MNIAYSLYFRILEITEKETFQIWERSQTLVNRFKSQFLHTWSETVRFILKSIRQNSYDDCILTLLPYFQDYGKTDLPYLNKEPDSRKSVKKLTSLNAGQKQCNKLLEIYPSTLSHCFPSYKVPIKKGFTVHKNKWSFKKGMSFTLLELRVYYFQLNVLFGTYNH